MAAVHPGQHKPFPLPPARERIDRAAYELFSRHGVRAVGVDAVVARANVAKKTLYLHYPSKEKLALAFLRRREELWTQAWLQEGINRRARRPADRLVAVFDLFESTMRTALLESQRRVLERIASGAPLAETFNTLIRLIEEQAEGMRCGVLLADAAQQSLRFVAAPSIPEDYKAGIVPYLRIAPNMGACGASAFLREPVYTADTGTDVLCEDCRDI